MIRLPLARNTIFIRLSILSITQLIVLFGILCIKLFTLWENDVNVSPVMFLLMVSFWISMFIKWKTFSIGFKSELQGGMQNTKAPISLCILFAAIEFGETALLLGWHSFRTWKGNAQVLYLPLCHLIIFQNTVCTEFRPCSLWPLWTGLAVHLPCSLGLCSSTSFITVSTSKTS